MRIVRTIFWALLLVALVVFATFNWEPVEVTIWDNMVLETKIPALVLIAFLIGLIPTWLYHRGAKWRLNRRIKTLENLVRSSGTSQSAQSQEAKDAFRRNSKSGEASGPKSGGKTGGKSGPKTGGTAGGKSGRNSGNRPGDTPGTQSASGPSESQTSQGQSSREQSSPPHSSSSSTTPRKPPMAGSDPL